MESMPMTPLPDTPTAQYDAHRDSSPPILSDLEVQTALRPPQGHGLYRSWIALRWKLSASFFARPLPLITSTLDLKVGDLCITLPVAIALIAINALGAKNKDTPGTGSLPSITLMIVFALAVRNNALLLTLTGIPFERALLYHKLFAIVTIVLSALHGLAYLLDTEAESDKLSTVHTGLIVFVLMVLLYLCSLGYIRRHYFEFFIRMHWILFLLVMVFAVIHGAAIALVGFVPWLLDLVFRLLYRAPKLKNDKNKNGVIAAQQVTVNKLPGNIVRIQFPRVRPETGESFNYDAGQYAFLCVPALSRLQWHPFTISSAPHEPFVTFHIKASGDWTNKLYAHIPSVPESMSTFEMLVDGPYGAASIDMESPQTYSHVVLFSGGIGLTPMLSIVNQLHYEFHHQERFDLQQVKLVWSVRDRDMIKAMANAESFEAKVGLPRPTPSYFPDALLTSNKNNDSMDQIFQTEIYLTTSEVDLENPVDQILKQRMRYNTRPDISTTLRCMGELAQAAGKDRVAVLVCGPGALVADVIEQAMKLSASMKIRFDVHSETFKF